MVSSEPINGGSKSRLANQSRRVDGADLLRPVEDYSKALLDMSWPIIAKGFPFGLIMSKIEINMPKKFP